MTLEIGVMARWNADMLRRFTLLALGRHWLTSP